MRENYYESAWKAYGWLYNGYSQDFKHNALKRIALSMFGEGRNLGELPNTPLPDMDEPKGERKQWYKVYQDTYIENLNHHISNHPTKDPKQRVFVMKEIRRELPNGPESAVLWLYLTYIMDKGI